MDLQTAMQQRHSVRAYLEKPLPAPVLTALLTETELCNQEGDLHIQCITGEPFAFQGFLARYGHFRGVQNYFALVGPDRDNLEEQLGYYGERLVLFAQTLGLSTCWVGLTYSKRHARIQVGRKERLVCVIALGYGAHPGVPHKSKPMERLCVCSQPMPDWFRAGMEAVLLAPTALNQQKFRFTWDGSQVEAQALRGPYTKVDLGIAKYHFELGAGKDAFHFASDRPS